MSIFKIHGKKIWVAGHNGMVGRAVVRLLKDYDCEILVTDRTELNITNQLDVDDWFEKNRPDAVIICAAKVGGILANSTYPAEFLYENLIIASNVIHASFKNNVEKLLFLGSSCIYPKFCEQPMTESSLLTGQLEETNEAYAIAKIAGIKLCTTYRTQYGADFISAMPTNLYGPFDNFNLESSHVLPALIRKTHEAKLENKDKIKVWGTGEPLREFLHVDDCASGIIFLLENYSDFEHVNIGSGEEISIRDLTDMVKKTVGFHGKTEFDLSKPDGTQRKLLNKEKINSLGWSSDISLPDGLINTYDWYLNN